MKKMEGLAVLCYVLTVFLGATSAKQGTPASPFHIHRTRERTSEEIDPDVSPSLKHGKHVDFAENEPEEIEPDAFSPEYTFLVKPVIHVDFADYESQDISSREQQSQPDTDSQRREDFFTSKALISNAISPLLTGDQKDTNLRTPGTVDKVEQTPSRQDAGVENKIERQLSARAQGIDPEYKHKREGSPERTPGQTPAEIPEETPEHTRPGIPEQTPKRKPSQQSEVTPEQLDHESFFQDQTFPSKLAKQSHSSDSGFTEHNSQSISSAKQQSQPGTDDQHPDPSPQNAIFADALSPLLHKDHTDPNAGNLVQDDSDEQNEYDDSLSVDQQSHPGTNSQIGKLEWWQTSLVEETLKHILDKDDDAEEMQEHVLDKDDDTEKREEHDMDKDEDAEETPKRVLDKEDDAEEMQEHVLDKDEDAEEMLLQVLRTDDSAEEKSKHFGGTNDNAEEMLLFWGTEDSAEEMQEHILDKDDDAEEMLMHVLDKDDNAEEKPKHFLGTDNNAEEMLLQVLGTDDSAEETPRHVLDKDDAAEEMLLHVMGKYDTAEEGTPRIPGTGKDSKAEHSPEQMPEVILEEISLNTFTPQHTYPDQPVKQSETKQNDFMDTLSADQQNLPESNSNIRELSSWQSELVKETISQILSKNGIPEEMASFPAAREGSKAEQTAEQSAELSPKITPELAPGPAVAPDLAPEQTAERSPDNINLDVFSPDYALQEELVKQSDPLDYDVVNIPSFGQTKAKPNQHLPSHTKVVADTELRFLETRKEAEQKTGFKTPKKDHADQMFRFHVSRKNDSPNHIPGHKPEELSRKDFPLDNAFSETHLTQSGTAQYDYQQRPTGDEQGQTDTSSQGHEQTSSQAALLSDKNSQVSGTAMTDHMLGGSQEQMNAEALPPDYAFLEKLLEKTKSVEQGRKGFQPSDQQNQPDPRSPIHEYSSTQSEHAHDKNAQVPGTGEENAEQRSKHTREKFNPENFPLGYTFPGIPVQQSKLSEHDHKNTQQERQLEISSHIHENESTQTEVVSEKNTQVSEIINNTEQRSEHTADEINPQEFPLDYTFPDMPLKQANTTEYEYKNIPFADQQSQSDAGSSSLQLASKNIAQDTDEKDGVSTTNAKESPEVITREIDPDDSDTDKKERVSKTSSEKSPEENTREIDTNDYDTDKKDSVSKTNAEEGPKVTPREIDINGYDTDKKERVSKTNSEQSPEENTQEIDPNNNDTDKKDSVSKTNAEQSPEVTPEEINPQDFPPDYTFPDNPEKHSAEYDEVDIPSTEPQSPDSRVHQHSSTQTELETAGNTTVSWATNNTTSQRSPEALTKNASAELKPEGIESTTFHPTETFPKEPVTQSDSLDYEYEGIIPVHQKAQRGKKAQSHKHPPTKNSTVSNNSTRDMRTHVNSTQKPDFPASTTNGSAEQKPEQAPLDPQNVPSNYTSPEKFTNRTAEYNFEDTPSSQKQSQNDTGSQIHELSKIQAELYTNKKAIVSGEDDKAELTHEETSEEFDPQSFPADYTFPEELTRPSSAEYESGGIHSSNDKGQPSVHSESQQNSSTQAANIASENGDNTERNLGSQVTGKVNNTQNASPIPANGTVEKAGQNIQKATENLPGRNTAAQPTRELSPESKGNVHSDQKRQPQKETVIVGQEKLATTQSPDSKPTPHNVDVLPESKGSEHSNSERQLPKETVMVNQETLVTTQSPDSKPTPHNVDVLPESQDSEHSNPQRQLPKETVMVGQETLVTTQSPDSKPTPHNVDVLPESQDSEHSNPQRQPQEETVIVGQETLMTTQSPDSEPTPHNVEFSSDSKDKAFPHPEKQSEVAEQDILVTTQSTDSVAHVPTGKPEDSDKDDDALEVSDEDVLRMTNATDDNAEYDELDVEMTTEYEGRLYRFRRAAMTTTDEGSTTPTTGMVACQMPIS